MTDHMIRLDKWLWAARFFKTRALAKTAIEGGKVHCNGQRIKPSHKAVIGAVLKVRQGFTEKTVVITALSERRGSATQAAELYQETTESLAKREHEVATRKAMGPPPGHNSGRPDKKQRRKLIELGKKSS